MVIRSSIGKDTRMIVHECKGKLNASDFLKAFENLPELEGYDINLNVLWDLRHADVSELTNDEIFLLSTGNKERLSKDVSEYKVAFVVSDDLTYGLANMYKSFSSRLPVQISIFRNWDDAQSWILKNDSD